MSADTSELDGFIAELGAVPDEVALKIPGVVEKGAVKVKQAIQADFGRSRHFGHISRTISYDVLTDDAGVSAEIGPDKSRGGGARLAHIAIWGGANGGGGTVRDPSNALEDEAGSFVMALSRLLGDVL